MSHIKVPLNDPLFSDKSKLKHICKIVNFFENIQLEFVIPSNQYTTSEH